MAQVFHLHIIWHVIESKSTNFVFTHTHTNLNRLRNENWCVLCRRVSLCMPRNVRDAVSRDKVCLFVVSQMQTEEISSRSWIFHFWFDATPLKYEWMMIVFIKSLCILYHIPFFNRISFFYFSTSFRVQFLYTIHFLLRLYDVVFHLFCHFFLALIFMVVIQSYLKCVRCTCSFLCVLT